VYEGEITEALLLVNFVICILKWVIWKTRNYIKYNKSIYREAIVITNLKNELRSNIQVTKTDFIWYNSHLKINDKVLYLKCMSENGIKKIEDLIDDNNRFLTYQMFLDTLFESSLKFKDEYHTSKSCQNFDLITNL
jgi:hypothetical protein